MKYARMVLIVVLAYAVCLGTVGLGKVSYDVYKTINDRFISLNNRIDLIEYYQDEQYDDFSNLYKKPSYDYLKSMIVRIYQKANEEAEVGGLGTGTVVKMTEDATYILTNKHVATMGNYVVLLDEENEVIVKCEVLKNSEKYDLSLIKAPIKLKNKQAFKGVGKIDYQEKAYSVGMFLGLKYIYTEGTFAGYEDDSFLLNTPAGPGCSGSGVFNKNGELVAVIYAGNIINYFQIDTAKAVCVTGEQVKEFLKELL